MGTCAPPSTRAIQVFFHIGALNAYAVKVAHLMLQAMAISGLLKHARLFVGIVGNYTAQLRLPRQAVVVARSVDLKAYEFPTLRAVWEYSRDHPKALVLYLHTKGILPALALAHSRCGLFRRTPQLL